MAGNVRGLEAQVMRKCIEELLSHGFFLAVHDGMEQVNPPSSDADAVFADLFTVDEEHLRVFQPGEARHFGWLFLVYGNDGYDVICDNTFNIEPFIVQTVELARTLEPDITDLIRNFPNAH